MSVHDQRTAAEIDQLHEKLARRLGDSSLPTLPQVAIEVLKLVDCPNSGIRDFTNVIKTDQALTGRMLRLANSAAYAQRGAVKDLQRAIVLLGLERTKAMALGFHLSESMKGCANTSALWTQSLMRAWIAFHIVDRYNRTLTGQAFVIGLMLDASIGVMPTLADPAYFDRLDPATDPTKLYLFEKQQYEFTHVDLATVMTTKMWRFPQSLSKPISRHHERARACDPRNDDALLMAVANFVGTLPLDADSTVAPEQKMMRNAYHLFKLNEAGMREVLKNAATDFDATKQMFGSVIDPTLTSQGIIEAANKHLGVEPEERQQDIDSGTLKFEGTETCIELSGRDGNRLDAFLSDLEGNRLFSITIDPAKQTTEQIREELMLDTHPEEQAQKIMQMIGQLAA